ncbi:MFS transporter [Kitasatospora sp. NPDC048540]|uniref:MFS transporter n=1 Tax=unclassified Kitasatospora TaxID=2633591 RepID=UPI0006896D23|nr:MFS transporter [Kitasatospora sp. MBT63]
MSASAIRPTRFALWAVSLALFCVQLDLFTLNLAVPSMAADLHVAPAAMQWAVSGYLLAAGALMIAFGRLGDLLGHRRVLLIGVTVFGAASLACALVSSAGVLVALRVVQGAGAAMIMPVGLALLTDVFPAAQRGRAMGFAFAVAGVGTAAGPFVGGALTEWAGWRWIFLINVPFAMVAALLIRKIPTSDRGRKQTVVDWPGVALVTVAVAALIGGVDRSHAWGWVSARTLGLFAVGALALVAFVVVESRVRHPLINLSLFRDRKYVMITSTGTVANAAIAVCLAVAALYLQQVRHLSPVGAGVAYLLPAIAIALMGPVAGRLSRRRSPLRVLAAATAIGGAALLAVASAHGLPFYIVAVGVCCAALQLGYCLTTIATQSVVRRERAGEASGVTLTAMVTGAGVGTALTDSSLAGKAVLTSGVLSGPLLVAAVACLGTAGVLAFVRSGRAKGAVAGTP